LVNIHGMVILPEYTDMEVLDRIAALGISPELQDYFRQCIPFHGYAAPGLLIGVFMVDYALEILGKNPTDKIFVTIETHKCLPDPPQVILHATAGNHRLRILSIGKFALVLTTFTSAGYTEGVRVYLDRKKLARYPAIAPWYDNSPDFKPGSMKRQLIEEILTAGRDILSAECIRMKVSPKKKWRSAVCSACGEQVPEDLMEGTVCAGCGSMVYYEKCAKELTGHYE
jgi:formylmethanofuran dehydrogenase subunit E